MKLGYLAFWCDDCFYKSCDKDFTPCSKCVHNPHHYDAYVEHKETEGDENEHN